MAKYSSCCDLCVGLWDASKAAVTGAQLCGKRQEQPRLLCRSAGDSVIYSPSSDSWIATRYFVSVYSFLLLSQDLLHHNMACILHVSVNIYIQSIWPQMVIGHNWTSTSTQPVRSCRDAPLGGSCGEIIELGGSEPTINTPPHLLQHTNAIHETELFCLNVCTQSVRRYDATQHSGSMRLCGSTEFCRERVGSIVQKDRVCMLIMW
jgi:hypothetical protein